jgi:hypothetical protein
MIGRTALVLACAAALLAACGTVTAGPAPAPAAKTPTAATPAPDPTPAPSRTGTPEQVAAAVAAAVPADRPRLLPRSLPTTMVGRVQLYPEGYMVTYANEVHTKEITFAAGLGMNPPLPSEHAYSGWRQFRGVRASYQVYEPASPTSLRYLDWREPGAWPRLPSGAPTDEMYLSASGLTEAEFLAVANSVGPVS